MKLRRLACIAATLLIGLSWCGIASAAYSINTTGFSHTGGTGVSLNLVGVGGKSTSSGGPFQFTRGSVNPGSPTIWNALSGPSGAFTNGTGSQFTAYCIDLAQNLSASDSYTLDNLALAPTPPSGSSPLAPMGQLAALRLGVLWYQHVHGAVNAYLDTNNADGRAAFQLAVWEITYDSQLNIPLSLSTGNLTSGASGTVINLVNNWLTSINAVDLNYNGPVANVWAMNDTNPANAQNQLVELGPGFADVPEPATLAIWGLGGAIGLMVARRRKA